MPYHVTLLTDFGLADSYVAEMKAAMLTAGPELQFIDITHTVPPGDVAAARYLISRSWHRFSPGTVHLIVVDPGVGTSRRALAVRAHGQAFVAPDNGVLTDILDGAEVVGLPLARDVSPTFQGRDVFAPAAAQLAIGTPLTSLGTPVTDAIRLTSLDPTPRGKGWEGAVIYVDGFGNLVTNLRAEQGKAGHVRVGRRNVGPLRRTFGDVPVGALVAYLGSGGTIEVAVRNGSAAKELKAKAGAKVLVAPR